MVIMSTSAVEASIHAVSPELIWALVMTEGSEADGVGGAAAAAGCAASGAAAGAAAAAAGAAGAGAAAAGAASAGLASAALSSAKAVPPTRSAATIRNVFNVVFICGSP